MSALEDNSISQDRYKLVFETSSDAIMLLDEKGFFDCNPATLNVFGYQTKEEFLGKHPSQHSPPTQPDGKDSLTKSKEKINEAYEKGISIFEWVHRKGSGEYFPAEVKLTSFTLEGKSVIQAIVRDISLRKKNEEIIKERTLELEKINKLMMGRELKMIELKEKITELEQKLKEKMQ